MIGFVVGTTKNAAARPTIGCMAAAGVMAGMGLGLAGRMIWDASRNCVYVILKIWVSIMIFDDKG